MTIEAVLAPGARVVVRDEEWLVRSAVPVATGGYAVRVVGMSELVRNLRGRLEWRSWHVLPRRIKRNVGRGPWAGVGGRRVIPAEASCEQYVENRTRSKPETRVKK